MSSMDWRMGVRSPVTCWSEVDSDAGEERCSAGAGEPSMMSRNPARSSFLFSPNHSGVFRGHFSCSKEASAGMKEYGCLKFGADVRQVIGGNGLVARQVGPRPFRR